MALCKQGKTVPVLLCILLWMAQYNFLISNANTETWSIYKYRYQSDTQVIHSGHLALGPEILTNIGHRVSNRATSTFCCTPLETVLQKTKHHGKPQINDVDVACVKLAPTS